MTRRRGPEQQTELYEPPPSDVDGRDRFAGLVPLRVATTAPVSGGDTSTLSLIGPSGLGRQSLDGPQIDHHTRLTLDHHIERSPMLAIVPALLAAAANATTLVLLRKATEAEGAPEVLVAAAVGAGTAAPGMQRRTQSQ